MYYYKCFSGYWKIFAIEIFGFNEFPDLTEKMTGPEPSGIFENHCSSFSLQILIHMKTLFVGRHISMVF